MSNTKTECTGMVILSENDSNTKAIATVTVNDEFVLKGLKVVEGKNGLFVAMPSRKFGNDYQEVVFPVTKEAREQLFDTVLNTYSKLQEEGLDKFKAEDKELPNQAVSKIDVVLNHADVNNKKSVVAVGQIKIDDCIVVSGVTVKHGTNKNGDEKDFVSMPAYKTQDKTGEYNYVEYAHAITKECRAKIDKEVLGAFETLQKTEHKGVKFSELGEKSEISSKYGMNKEFAQKLMDELDKQGITYSAKVAGTTSLSVRNEDKAAVDSIEKQLSDVLKEQNQKQSAQQKHKTH